jgi:CheY-like chemotaxis protein
LRFEAGHAGQRPESAVTVKRAGKVDENAVTAEITPPPPAPPAKPKRRRRAGGKKTILVVEDVDYFVQLAQDALGAKYRTIIVKTVEEAVQAIEREPIDLLVLDLTLGGEDDSSLLERLEPKEFPILISTSRDETEMYGEAWERLKRQGADDLVIKGMNMEETLLQKVVDLLGTD